MARLDPSIFAELNMGAAMDFDGVEPISLSRNFGSQVQNVGTNFDVAASAISFSSPTNG